MQKDARSKTLFQVVLFTIIGVAILFFMWQSQGRAYAEDCDLRGIAEADCSLYDKLLRDFRNADMFWLIIISICFIFSQVFRAIRWRMLLGPMGYHISYFNSFATLMVGYFANLGVPRIGEFVRAGLITKYEGVPIEKAFATIVIERIVDVIMLLIMIALGFIFHFEALWGYISDNMVLETSDIIVAIAVLLIAGATGIYLIKMILDMDDAKLHPVVRKVKNLVRGFLDGLWDIKKLPNVPGFVLYSIGIWLMYFLMHYLAFFAYEPVSHLTPIDGILVFDFGSLGVVFPSPGGMGSYHFMIVESLKILGVSPVNGFSFAMISFFTLTIFCTILIGLISLILLPLVNRRKKDQ